MTINRIHFPTATIDTKTGQISLSNGEGYIPQNIFSDINEPGKWLDSEGNFIDKYNKLSFDDICHKEKWNRI